MKGFSRYASLSRELGSKIRDSLDSEEVLKTTATGIGMALGVQHVYIRVEDTEGLLPLRAQYVGPGRTEIDPDLLLKIYTRTPEMARSGTWVVDDGFEPRWSEGIREAGRLLQMRSGIILNLDVGGKALGRIYLGQDTPRKWTDAEVLFAESVVADLGRSLVNARLYAGQQRLIRQLEEADRARRLALDTAELGRRIRDADGLDAAVRTAAPEMGALLGADSIHIAIRTTQGVSPFSSIWTADAAPPPLSLEFIDDLFHAMPEIAKARLVVCRDVDADPIPPAHRIRLKRDGIHAGVLAPIISGESRLGLIAVGQFTPRDWTEEELAAIEVLAADLGRSLARTEIYLINNQMFTDLAALDRQRRTTLRAVTLGRRLRDSLDSDRILELAVAGVGELAAADRVHLRLFDEFGLFPHRIEWTAEGVPKMGWDLLDELAPRVTELRTMETCTSADVLAETDRWSEGLVDYMRRSGMVAGVFLPLALGDRMLGRLAVCCAGQRQWTDYEIGCIESVATDLASALGNADLYAQQKRMVVELDELGRRKQRALDAETLSQELGASLDMGRILRTAVRGVGQRLEIPYIFVQTFASERMPASAFQWAAPDTRPIDDTAVARHKDLVERVDEDEVLLVEDVGDPQHNWSERLLLWMKDSYIRSFISVPVLFKGTPIGRISACDSRTRVWQGSELAFLETVATEIGRALDRAALYVNQLQLVNELEALDTQKSEFISTVSHELRTPLTSISGYVELLMDEDLPKHQHRMLEIVDRNARRLRSLIEDILMLSRIDAGHIDPRVAPLDLRETVAQVVEDLTPQAEAKGVTLVNRLPDDAVVVNGDRDQLSRLVLNLAHNAVKFTPEGGTVTVAVLSDGPDPGLRITDTGIGIPADDLPYIFERFRRGANATEKSLPGTGLGLAICEAIVRAHHGHLMADSVQDEGTTMTVILQSPPSAESAPAP
ncbi:GAF domain-containing protein [Actinocorallia longicatena]|uniref:histidine kinase n=1 Tax=Actinocorallia longicatena TaxID=111803 RepID=A0ABP6QCW8_9ACTN